MSETPRWTVEQVADIFADDGGLAGYYDPINGHREVAAMRARFLEWLAAHDAEVRAEQRAEHADYREVFGRDPEPWRFPLGALRLTLAGDPAKVDVRRAQAECEELVRVLNDGDHESFGGSSWSGSGTSDGSSPGANRK